MAASQQMVCRQLPEQEMRPPDWLAAACGAAGRLDDRREGIWFELGRERLALARALAEVDRQR